MTRAESTTADVRATHHLLDRWDKRFPGHDLDAAFARSVRLTTAKALWLRLGVKAGQAYRLDRQTGAVFVLAWDARGYWCATTVIRRAGP
jgi:hypothetical protein